MDPFGKVNESSLRCQIVDTVIFENGLVVYVESDSILRRDPPFKYPFPSHEKRPRGAHTETLGVFQKAQGFVMAFSRVEVNSVRDKGLLGTKSAKVRNGPYVGRQLVKADRKRSFSSRNRGCGRAGNGRARLEKLRFPFPWSLGGLSGNESPGG